MADRQFHVHAVLLIFDGLSRQSPEGEQTHSVFVTFQAPHSTVTTCVAGDPPLCDNRNHAAIFIEHRAVVAESNAGLEAGIQPFPAPSSSQLLDDKINVRNLVTLASDVRQFDHNGECFLEHRRHPQNSQRHKDTRDQS